MKKLSHDRFKNHVKDCLYDPDAVRMLLKYDFEEENSFVDLLHSDVLVQTEENHYRCYFCFNCKESKSAQF